MADTRHLERFLNTSGPRHEPETEASEVRDAYEEVRIPKGRGRESPCVDVRLADGPCEGLPYAYLVRVRFVPGDTIWLCFPDLEVVVQGRRLRDLYRRLLWHRVEVIQEGTESEEGLKADDAAHIDHITINPKEQP